MSFVFQEISAENLRSDIQTITGDNSVLMIAGNIKMFGSSVASCRYASELTFKPIAVCFLHPQKNVIRFLEKNEYFTLSYFSPQYQHLLNSFGVGVNAEKIDPGVTPLENVYHPQAEWVFECRKVFNLELILSSEIQTILTSEKKRSIYPGNESPRMFIGEIVNGWHKILKTLARGTGHLLPEANKNKCITSPQ